MLKLNPGLRGGLCASILTASCSLGAVENDDVLVVTASGTEQNLRDAPASISVITQADLQKKPVINLKDVLKEVPGVQLTDEGDNRRGISIRGLDSSYTLILIDGKRINSRNAVFRHNDLDLNWVSIDAIERIEVIRGPMSSLYGSDALGGVVNIITRKVGQAWHGKFSVDTTQQQHRDMGDTYNTNFFTSGPIIDSLLGVKVYGALNTRGKDSKQPSGNSPNAQPGLEGFTSRNLNTEFSWTPVDNQDVLFAYGFNRQDRDSDSLNKNRIERNNYSIQHNGRWEFAQSDLRFYGDKIDNRNAGGNNTITSRNNTVEGKLSLPLADINQLLVLGGEWRHDQLNDSVNTSKGSSPKMTGNQYALFIEDEWRLFEPLALTAGVRMDDHNTYGTHYSPRAYLVYNATDTVTVKGGWASAFKAPSLLELSPNWTTVSCRGICQIVGNPNLQPETSKSLELGLYYAGDSGVLEDVTGSVTLFQNDLENMIDIQRTGDRLIAPSYPNYVGTDASGNPIFRYFNVNKARVRGVETELKVPVSDSLKLSLNYTYNDGRNLSDGSNKPLERQPYHTANGIIDWTPVDDWAFYLQGNYTGQKRAISAKDKVPGGYVVWNVGASWQMTKQVKLRSGILNVADKSISRDDYSFTEEGRRLFMAMDYTF